MKEMTKDNIKDIAELIISKTDKHKGNSACIITLSGPLGAGKTTLTQTIAKILKARDKVISPTFVIMKKYKITSKKFKKLIHIDAYRLKSSEEIAKLGFEEIKKDKSNLIIIEWPSQIDGAIPKNTIKINIDHKSELIRTIKFTSLGLT